MGALYAAAGIDPGRLIEAAARVKPWSVLDLALARWRIPILSHRAERRPCGVAAQLKLLEKASFTRLHHGVRRLGIMVYDLYCRRERLVYGGPGLETPDLPLARAVAATLAIPGLFPPVRARCGDRTRLLLDAGWYTAVPVESAFAPPVGAHHVIAVDLGIRLTLRQRRRGYWEHLEQACGDRLLILRPRVESFGTMLLRRGDPERLVAAGEDAVGARELEILHSWR